MKYPVKLHRKLMETPLALVVALVLGSCALAPDRYTAQRDHATDEPTVTPERRPTRVVAASRDSRATLKIEVSAPEMPLATEKSLAERLLRDQPPLVSPLSLAPTIAATVTTEERDKPARAKKEPESTNPYGARLFRRLQRQDEHGEIPADGLEKARQHVTLMKAAQQARLDALRKSGKAPAPGAQAAGIEPNSWTWLGPGNVGGRIRSIVIHPTNANNMWVGSVSGGIWRTTNAGASWFPVNDFMASLAVSTMVMNPTNPNIMYAGTGESFAVDFNAPNQALAPDGLQGAGVFKSTDGGVTWNHLLATAYNNGIPPAPNPNFFYVNRLAISPDGNTVLADTSTGIWRSADGGATWAQGRRIIFAGNVQPVEGPILDVDFLPGDNNQAILSGNGMAMTTIDRGQIWAEAIFTPGISGRVEVAYAPSSPNIVYASVNQSQGQVYRSTDGGATFTRRNATVFQPDPEITYTLLGTQGGYDNIVWVNPQDPNFVMVGGIFLYRSRDGGNTFEGLGDSPTNRPHTDQHMILAHPGFNNTTNRTVFVGNDGGIFRFADVNVARLDSPAGFTELNNNLGITQFYGAAGNPATGVIVGGTQDNGTPRFSGNEAVPNFTETWTQIPTGDGGFCAVDPIEDIVYVESQNLAVQRSVNGAQAVPITSGLADSGVATNFIAPLVLDPNNAETLLAGGVSLWRSNNVKDPTPTWTAIKNAAAGNPISAIAVSPITSSLVLVGHNNGDIFRTFNGTASPPVWTKINTAALPPRMVTRLIIDPTRGANWIYATFGGFSGNNVYRTIDNGVTWVDVTGAGATGLPAVPVRTLVFHPTDANLLYVGTEVGIFTSENAGATWEPSQDGPANVSVDELFWMGSNLVAATHGRGIYRASGGIYVDKNSPFFFEFGTSDFPFKTVTQGKNAATKYKAVWIKPGNYNETMTIDNPNGLELRALGGTVTIGNL